VLLVARSVVAVSEMVVVPVLMSIWWSWPVRVAPVMVRASP
jgi:hypothetical protein